MLVGYSSGAHLVALLGANGEYLTEAGLDESRVRATVSLDVHAYDVPFALQLMVGSTVEQNIPLIEHLFGDPKKRSWSATDRLHGLRRPRDARLSGASPEDVGSHGYIVSQAAERARPCWMPDTSPRRSTTAPRPTARSRPDLSGR